jgi:hypothetical protein
MPDSIFTLRYVKSRQIRLIGKHSVAQTRRVALIARPGAGSGCACFRRRLQHFSSLPSAVDRVKDEAREGACRLPWKRNIETAADRRVRRVVVSNNFLPLGLQKITRPNTAVFAQVKAVTSA